MEAIKMAIKKTLKTLGMVLICGAVGCFLISGTAYYAANHIAVGPGAYSASEIKQLGRIESKLSDIEEILKTTNTLNSEALDIEEVRSNIKNVIAEYDFEKDMDYKKLMDTAVNFSIYGGVPALLFGGMLLVESDSHEKSKNRK